MIVIDASAAVACLIRSAGSSPLLEKIAAADRVAAPTLILYEVGSALRRLCLARKIDAARALAALDAIGDLVTEQYDAGLFARRAWDLRQTISYYDASYVSLAEVLKVPLLTADRRLAATMGHRAEIITV